MRSAGAENSVSLRVRALQSKRLDVRVTSMSLDKTQLLGLPSFRSWRLHDLKQHRDQAGGDQSILSQPRECAETTIQSVHDMLPQFDMIAAAAGLILVELQHQNLRATRVVAEALHMCLATFMLCQLVDHLQRANGNLAATSQKGW